jgi:Tol biopolymer transport system component
MPELKEVFDMVTKQTEPDLDSWNQQEHRQRRAARNRKIGGLVVAAAVIGAVALVLSLSLGGTPEERTGGPPTQGPPADPAYSATVVSADGEIVEVIPGIPPGASNLEFSPDGQTIAFMQENAVWTIGRDGSDLRVLDPETHTPDRTPNGDAQEGIAWSPDGSRIAFVLGEDIYVMDADGSDVRQLTTAPGGDYQPAWSSQDVIAYWHGSSSGVDGGPANAEIYTIPADGGTPTRLTHDDVSSIAPAWSPDGTQIVHWQGGDLQVMGADGSGANSLGVGGWSPAWSPDGARVAFLECCASYRPDDGAPLLEVRVLDLESGTVENLDRWVPTDLNGPSWSPEGTLLFLQYD